MNPSTPDLMEPVVGLRAWFVKNDRTTPFEPRLYGAGLGRHTLWEPHTPIEAHHEGVNAASCRETPCDGTLVYEDSAPTGTRNYCGLHAFKLDDEALAVADFGRHFSREAEWQGQRTYMDPGVRFAVGTVSLWGRMVEHEHGYRAQFAYPRTLIGASSGVNLAALAETYGIPYRTVESDTWKSVFQSVALSPSHSAYPSHFVPSLLRAPIRIPIYSRPQFLANDPPSNRSSFQPSNIPYVRYLRIREKMFLTKMFSTPSFSYDPETKSLVKLEQEK